MTKIFKYALSPEGDPIHMPEGAKLLSVQVQRDVPCIWALVDTDSKMVYRKVFVVGTGHEFLYIPEAHRYIGTFQLLNLGLVFHVFDAGEV